VRLGQVHRNTFVNAPLHLDPFYRLKVLPRARLAGQITGVEGYLESAATGLAAALYLTLARRGVAFSALPTTTALGALARHLTESDSRRFQPANVNYGLFPPLPGRASRGDRRAAFAARAAVDLADWAAAHGFEIPVNDQALVAG
jgi:methylenetetrahydrofolate--tRNA-(uracil-5-)-methyltransferase